jgi:hypothetical protein
VLDRERSRAFFENFLPFQQRIARLGLLNSLSLTLLRLTAPGVPDIYQGCELWDFSLVDPDNRRPVDFERRRMLLQALDGVGLGAPQRGESRTPSPNGLGAVLDDGRAKLHLIRRALHLRRQRPELFTDGDYRPLAVEGPHAERLCVFSRSLGGRSLVVIVPRLLAGLTELAEDGVSDTGETGANGHAEGPDAPAAARTGERGGDPLLDPGWDETWIAVPAARLNDVLSSTSDTAEQPLATESRNGHAMLRASTILRRFPVGLLTTGKR